MEQHFSSFPPRPLKHTLILCLLGALCFYLGKKLPSQETVCGGQDPSLQAVQGVLSLVLCQGAGVTLDGVGLRRVAFLCSLSPPTNLLKGKEIHEGIFSHFPLEAAKGKMFVLLPPHHWL